MKTGTMTVEIRYRNARVARAVILLAGLLRSERLAWWGFDLTRLQWRHPKGRWQEVSEAWTWKER